jgi:hypothetical protein
VKAKPLASIKIAPRLDRKSHKPICGHWTVGDFPSAQEWDEDDWKMALDIFEDRLYGRFLNPIHAIERTPNSGFSVMALDCMLIETLQQFFEGEQKTPRAGHKGDKERGSEAYFGKFLTRTAFQRAFGNEYGDDTLAHRFYDQIRCGILHQAETKTDSRIVFAPATEEIIRATPNGIVVYRSGFHALLIQIFEGYVRRLRKPSSSEDRNLREQFKKKMKYICRIEFEE